MSVFQNRLLDSRLVTLASLARYWRRWSIRALRASSSSAWVKPSACTRSISSCSAFCSRSMLAGARMARMSIMALSTSRLADSEA